MISFRLVFTLLYCCCATIVAASTVPHDEDRHLLRPGVRKDNNKRKNNKKERHEKKLRKYKLRNACPSMATPPQGASCRRSPRLDACEYDFVAVPTADDNDQCTGDATCQALTQCSCIDKQWDCTYNMEVDLCEGSLLPDVALQECTPGRDIVTTPVVQEEEDNPNKGDLFVSNEEGNGNAQPTCPVNMPMTGDRCTATPVLVEQSSCLYDHVQMPMYQADGYCAESITTCVPLATCQCTVDGEWECFTASVRRCRDGDPPGAFASCTP